VKMSYMQLPYAQESTSSLANAPGILLQRQCACRQRSDSAGECESCRRRRKGNLQRSAMHSSPISQVPPIVHEVLRSPGAPLDAETRAFMEPRFEHDFSQVRVHSDARAAESARAVNSLAYTVGRDIVFGSGRFVPETSQGRRLIAHELTHVVQQSNSTRLLPQSAMSEPEDASEREADAAAGNLVSDQGMSIAGINPTELQVSREFDPFGESLPPSEEPKRPKGSTLPYREATELAECIRIMGDANRDYCRQTVLGEPPPAPFRAPASLSVNPVEVRPRGTDGVNTAMVTVTGAAPGSRLLRPTVTAVANSGGHQHNDQRPMGTISPASRTADASGRADFTYRSNQSGGTETITANVAGDVVQANIDIRVPDLLELTAGADYDLVGQTANHPDNHFATAATIASLQQIAANYEAHKVANNLPGWPRVAYNDISLVRGGIFDINGDWAPPHQTHRNGRIVDFRINNLNAAQRAVLRGIINAEGGAILNEGNHWHLTF
jgi:hypothetical protein